MRQSIVLDLDGVIADIAQSIDDWLFYNNGIPNGEYDYTNWLISAQDDTNAMSVFNNPLFWKNMKPYEDAWYQINNWFSKDIDVYIVTARRCESAIKQTQAWLDIWRINTMPPIFTNVHKKYHEIKKINPIFVVEDNPNEVEILIENGINTYLRKQWYNKQYWDKFPTIETLWDLDWN